MEAYRKLAQGAIDNGFTVSVCANCDWLANWSTDIDEIVDAVKSVGEAEYLLCSGDIRLWALVSAYGLADDETVIDSNDSPWIDKFME